MGPSRARSAALAIVVACIELTSLSVLASPASASGPSSTAYPQGYNASYFQKVNSSSANESSLARASFSPPPAPAWPTSANWYTYQWNLTRSGYNPNESVIASSNISSLQPIWKQSGIRGPITASMISVNGSIYVGSWNGTFYSLNAANGAINWHDRLTSGVNSTGGLPGNGHIHGGIYSTPTYYNGMIYETAGVSNLTAIYPTNGTVAWCADVGNNSTNPASQYYKAQIWSSPVVYGGFVYVGQSSASDNYAYQGLLVQVPIAGPTASPASNVCKVYHPVRHTFFSIPLGACLSTPR
jgi:hypothetical protein